MAEDDHDPGGRPRAIRRPEAVIDLRAEPPVRHRQTRGVPREPDLLMRSYRNRAAHRGPRVPTGQAIEAASVERSGGRMFVDPDELVDPDGLDDRGADGTSRSAAPLGATAPAIDDDTAPTGAGGDGSTPGLAPTGSLTESGADSGRRQQVGDLVVRRVRLRSVAKVSFTFYLCIFSTILVAGAVLWHLANEQGWVKGWTGFLVSIGFSDAAVDGTALARASFAVGGILLVTVTLATVVLAFFYNQLSGLLGGVVVTVQPRTKRRRRRDRP